jgi:LysM repeat protein
VALTAGLILAAACGGSGNSSENPSPSPESSPLPLTQTPIPLIKAFQYEIQDGDSVYGLALRFNTTVEEIVALNGLNDIENIGVGEILLIPGDPPSDLPSPRVTAVPQNPIGSGYLFPIGGSCLPNADNLMPNAPREYRAGIHEGVDFYTGYNCAPVQDGTPVLAVKFGTIIRADHDFVEMTPEKLDEILNRSKAQGYTDTEALDLFRGRQVWLDHGNGITTRYCHLSDIPPEIQVRSQVEGGVVIGYAGESGTPEAITNPGSEIHLHFEIRVGDSFLGAGLDPDQVRTVYDDVFSLP